jgi:hypothetical protein
MCWHTLFLDRVIVEGYPILGRFHEEHGLEVPFVLMKHLVDAAPEMDFSGWFLIKGLSSIFVPTVKDHSTPQVQENNKLLMNVSKFPSGSAGIRYASSGTSGTPATTMKASQSTNEFVDQANYYPAIPQTTKSQPLSLVSRMRARFGKSHDSNKAAAAAA